MAPRQFTKRLAPATIQATRVDLDDMVLVDELTRWCGGTLDVFRDAVVIETLEGEMLARHGDWVICLAGEFYPCRDDIFQQSYVEVE